MIGIVSFEEHERTIVSKMKSNHVREALDNYETITDAATIRPR